MADSGRIRLTQVRCRPQIAGEFLLRPAVGLAQMAHAVGEVVAERGAFPFVARCRHTYSLWVVARILPREAKIAFIAAAFPA